MARSQLRRGAPCLTVGLRIHRDGKEREIGKCRVPKSGIGPPLSNTHFENVGNLQSPKRRNPCPGFYNSRKDTRDLFRSFGGVDPSKSDGTVENKAQGRPSSRSVLRVPQSKRSDDRRSARARMRSAAAFALARSIPVALATKRATGLPCLVITISSPRSTRSNREPRVFLASKAPISCKSSP